jgi:hypothetical protein
MIYMNKIFSGLTYIILSTFSIFFFFELDLMGIILRLFSEIGNGYIWCLTLTVYFDF